METNILKMISISDIASLANALSGLGAILAVLTGNTILSAQLLLLAVVFDSVDGILARKFNEGPMHALFGETIDSLADIVSFGVAPAIVIYMLTNNSLILIPVFLLVACGILRLTRYNTLLAGQTSPTEVFIGLPIPSSSMIVALLILTSLISFESMFILTIIISLLMISSIEYPKVRDMKVIVLTGILTILCIIPNINEALHSIPSYILLVLVLIYIFGLTIYNFIPANNYSISKLKVNNNVIDDISTITRNSSKSKKDLHKK